MTDSLDGDDIVRDLLPGYLERRRAELATLDTALVAEDYTALRTIGHNLRGSGGAYGLLKVSEFGQALEEAASAKDGEAVRVTIRRMRAFLEEIST